MSNIRVFQSPTRYIQQKGIIKFLKYFIRDVYPDLNNPGILLNNMIKYEHDIKRSFYNPQIYHIKSECSWNNVNEIVNTLKKDNIDHIITCGGGTLIDIGKIVADNLNIKSIIVPSSASTDAACSALSVLYKDDHIFQEYKFLQKSPDMIIVDSEIIANAPVRLLVAGMGDAMSTYYEANSCYKNQKAHSMIYPFFYRPTLMALAISKNCLDTLFTYGLKAKNDCINKNVTEDLENIIEANILSSSIGFENSGLAAAHGMHNALTLIPETKKFLHGELVAFGTIFQLCLENNLNEAIKVAKFNKLIGLPTCLQDLNINIDNIDILIQHCLEKENTCKNIGEINYITIYNALIKTTNIHKYI